MRAVVFKDHQLAVEEIPTPEPGPGQVLVKVRACGICGSDLHFVRHAAHMVEQTRALGYPTAELERGLATGLVLGHEFVGEIVKIGRDAGREFSIGDRVCSVPFVLNPTGPALMGGTPETPGAFAEYLILSEALLVRVPSNLPDEAAALTEPLGIAVHAVNKSGITSGDVAVVVGCGPIGLAIITVLAIRGVETILAGDLSRRRRELAYAMGASEVVDPSVTSTVAAGVASAAGRQVVIFENTGAPGLLGKSINEAPQNARIVVTGIAPGEQSFVPLVAIMKELTLTFVIYYQPAEFQEAMDILAAGKVAWRQLVTGTVGLEGVRQAFRDLENPEVHAKILVDPRQI